MQLQVIVQPSDELDALMNQSFGARPDQRELMERILADDDKRTLAAFEGPTLLGASIAGLLAEESATAAYGAFGETAMERLRGHRLGSMQAMAVADRAKRRGVASALGRAQMSWLLSQGCTLLLGVSWEHGDADNSSHLFRLGGFTQAGECHGFYRRFHQESGQRCPRCSTERCECTALLFVKEL